MKRFVLKYWWVFPLSLLVILVSLLFLFMTDIPIIENTVSILLLLTLIALPVSWVILLWNFKWKLCLISVLWSVLVVVLMLQPRICGAMGGADHFGRRHPIPEGMSYNIPLCSNDTAVTVDSLDADSYLQLWGDDGCYEYDFYYGALPAGEIFLRCYEATKNIPLSEDRLPESSKVRIDSTHSFSKLADKAEFTVYEGDFGDYYAARVEVWYRNAATDKEKKLMEKTYRVDGWQR